ncbi:hypothetical protein LZ554_006793 [Drepanopeziza brunnea f. sp. 'monogermtubi']|nr:hypothetical protein LZ554_006793 [Drepanopeziza brunnea f. sp. 'monogermtubi']
MEPPDTNPVLWTHETNDVTYGFTATTFTKTSRLGFKDTRPDGTPFIWFRKFNHERITNEAKALKLVSQQTSIPVPKLLDYGEHPDGRRYLVTELVPGVTLNSIKKRGCSMAIGKEHTEDTPCGTCWKQASMNALQFIENTVLPQLAKMTSHQRGIDGFVMPPSWLSPDMSPPWKGKEAWETLPLAKPDYVFQHGDLASHNLMMDPETLQPTALFDWEFAGYFPPGMENWLGSLDPVVYHNRHSRKAGAIAEFLPAEYLKCYDEWGDKAELHRLIEAGELPDPDLLR